MVETAEKVEKSVKEAPHAAANLTVTNEDMAASRTPTEARANVVQADGKINFGNIYGPEGINPEIATPLKAAKPGDQLEPATEKSP